MQKTSNEQYPQGSFLPTLMELVGRGATFEQALYELSVLDTDMDITEDLLTADQEILNLDDRRFLAKKQNRKYTQQQKNDFINMAMNLMPIKDAALKSGICNSTAYRYSEGPQEEFGKA
ncbi:hypothetical protein MBANPS3_012258 [Mucor bainieri]